MPAIVLVKVACCLKGVFPSLFLIGALVLLCLQGGGARISSVYAASAGQPVISVSTPQNNSVITVPAVSSCNDSSVGVKLSASFSDPKGLNILAWSAFDGVGPSWADAGGAQSVDGWGGATCEAEWNNTVVSSSFKISEDGRIVQGSLHEFNVTLVDGGQYYSMVFANNTVGGFSVVRVFYTLRVSTTPTTPTNTTTTNGQPGTSTPALTAPLILGVSLAIVLSGAAGRRRRKVAWFQN